MAEQDACPHLDSTGEVTKEDLLQKSKVGFHSFPGSELCQRCSGPGPSIITINLASLMAAAACSGCVRTDAASSVALHSQPTELRYMCVHTYCSHCHIDILLVWLQGTCQSCGAGGPNLWACLQVKSWLGPLSYIFLFVLFLFSVLIATR